MAPPSMAVAIETEAGFGCSDAGTLGTAGTSAPGRLRIRHAAGAVPLASGALPQPPRSEHGSTGATALPASTHQGLGAPGMVVLRGSGGAGAGGGCQEHPSPILRAPAQPDAHSSLVEGEQQQRNHSKELPWANSAGFPPKRVPCPHHLISASPGWDFFKSSWC